MEEYDSSDDLDDDWFYESVMRYNTLQMFYLQNVPEHIIQVDEFTVCIACKNDKCKYMELLELELPQKLTVPPEDEGRSKENDFKMISGMYIDKSLYQLGALRDSKKIVTSQISKKGLQIYSFHTSESGKNGLFSVVDGAKKCQVLETVDWETPNFTINQEEKSVICSKCNHKQLTVFDMNSQHLIREIKHPVFLKFPNHLSGCEDSCLNNNIRCQLLDKNLLVVLDAYTGLTAIIDLRTENILAELVQDKHTDTDECSWILSDYDFNTCASYFGTLSNKGSLCLYDIRNINRHVKNECFNSVVKDYSALKLKVANGERLSISGADSNIYVYNVLKDNIELTFTHNGHLQKIPNGETEHSITDHIWLPSVGDNFLLSICSNRSLNCWEYNASVG